MRAHTLARLCVQLPERPHATELRNSSTTITQGPISAKPHEGTRSAESALCDLRLHIQFMHSRQLDKDISFVTLFHSNAHRAGGCGPSAPGAAALAIVEAAP